MKDPNVLQLDFGFDCKPPDKEKPSKPNKNHKQDFVFDMMDALTSPVIVFNAAWKDTIPAGLLNNITIARMICLMKGEQMASLTEVVAYMMPRTFESPMAYEWVNIYTWAGTQHGQMFMNCEQRKAMAEIAPGSLSDYEQSLLNHLRQWIYTKRRESLKVKLKAEKPAKVKPGTTQSNLFDKL